MAINTFQQIQSADLPALLARGVLLVDLRRVDEWQATGIVADSLLLTFFDQKGRSNPSSWLDRLQRLVDPEEPLALLCQSGYRSAIVCDYLLEQGVKGPLHNVADGILGWLQAGLPVVSYEMRAPRS